MNERFIELIEKKLSNKISPEEVRELETLLKNNPELQSEYNEQSQIKEVLQKMKMKQPQPEIWDSYWLHIYNKVERRIGWIAVMIGIVILAGAASIEITEAFFNDTQSPWYLKFGTAALIFGILVLLISVLREKLFTRKHDKYKEIQR